jgi:hypothetical protein
LSESKIEEIIAMLWTILFAILWANHAPKWILWTVGIKAATDHLCSVVCAIREIRRETLKRWHPPTLKLRKTMALSNQNPASKEPQKADCPSASCCALGRDEFLQWLIERKGGVKFVESFYLEGPQHLDLPDTGDSYCWECAKKERWANRNKGDKYTRIRSEDWPSRDSHQFCERCYVPLEHVPTDYQFETETEYWLEETDDWNMSETDACLMANLVHFRVDDDKAWEKFAPVAAKILLHNVSVEGPAVTGAPLTPTKL